MRRKSRSLPHRQLRNVPFVIGRIGYRSLPHRQLRNAMMMQIAMTPRSLPHRQLRNVFYGDYSGLYVITAA